MCASACSPAHTLTTITPGLWWASSGTPTRTPFLDESAPEALTPLWADKFGTGYTDVPIVQGDLVLTSSPDKTLHAFRASDSKKYWDHHMNGAPIGALLRTNDRVFSAEQSRDGRVEAFNIARGRRQWTAKLHSPVVGGPVMQDSAIYVGNERGELFALRTDNGATRWRAQLGAGPAIPPVIAGGDLLVMTSRDTLYRIDRSNGRRLAALALPGTPSAPAALVQDRLVLPLYPNRVLIIRIPDLSILREQHVDSPILAAPVIDRDGSAFLLSRSGALMQLAPNGGAQHIADVGNAVAGSLTLVANGLLVGRLDGTLLFLRRTGERVWTHEFRHSLRVPVAVRNGVLYVPLGSGHMEVFHGPTR